MDINTIAIAGQIAGDVEIDHDEHGETLVTFRLDTGRAQPIVRVVGDAARALQNSMPGEYWAFLGRVHTHKWTDPATHDDHYQDMVVAHVAFPGTGGAVGGEFNAGVIAGRVSDDPKIREGERNGKSWRMAIVRLSTRRRVRNADGEWEDSRPVRTSVKIWDGKSKFADRWRKGDRRAICGRLGVNNYKGSESLELTGYQLFDGGSGRNSDSTDPAQVPDSRSQDPGPDRDPPRGSDEKAPERESRPARPAPTSGLSF